MRITATNISYCITTFASDVQKSIKYKDVWNSPNVNYLYKYNFVEGGPTWYIQLAILSEWSINLGFQISSTKNNNIYADLTMQSKPGNGSVNGSVEDGFRELCWNTTTVFSRYNYEIQRTCMAERVDLERSSLFILFMEMNRTKWS